MSEPTARVLLVDDDTALTELLSEYLTEAGLSVHTAPGGDEALTLLETEEVDLAVLDLSLIHISEPTRPY